MTDNKRNAVAEKMDRASKIPTPPVQWCAEARDEIDRLERENLRLQSALAASEAREAGLRGALKCVVGYILSTWRTPTLSPRTEEK